jgi:hypothetical protein
MKKKERHMRLEVVLRLTFAFALPFSAVAAESDVMARLQRYLDENEMINGHCPPMLEPMIVPEDAISPPSL